MTGHEEGCRNEDSPPFRPPPKTFKYVWANRITSGLGLTFLSAVILGGCFPEVGRPETLVPWFALGLFLLIVVARGFSVGLAIHNDIVTVRNIRCTYRMPLASIERVQWRPVSYAFQLDIVRLDGRIIRPYAVGVRGLKDGGLDAAQYLQYRLAIMRQMPLPPSQSEMMRLGRLPPPPHPR